MSSTRMVRDAEPRPAYQETVEATGIDPAAVGKAIVAEVREARAEFRRIMGQ